MSDETKVKTVGELIDLLVRYVGPYPERRAEGFDIYVEDGSPHRGYILVGPDGPDILVDGS